MALKQEEVAVLIPLFKERATESEVTSLKQCLKILGRHPIIFYAPSSLKINYYQDLIGRDRKLIIERFEDKNFADVNGYNKLMLKTEFYKRFKAYQYILIHQLDAWVFEDKLQSWCDCNYAYIGAPWFSDDKPANGLPHFMGVGNGGFSLRNVEKHFRILNKLSFITSPRYLVPDFLKNINLKKFRSLILNLTLDNNTHHLLGKSGLNEDVFWFEMSRKHRWFNVPDMLTASQFATETNCEKLYYTNNRQLPFGCHAWQTYEPNFWAQFVGYESVAL